MKKYDCIILDENQKLQMITIFSELNTRELKNVTKNIIHVTKSHRVLHPSPKILLKALKKLEVDLEKFYAICELFKTE